MRDLLRARGCTVVGETYLDLRSKRNDFRPVMRQIKNAGADVIFSTVVGDSTVYLYQAFAEAGLDARVTPIASLTTTESEVRAMGFDVAAGHITAAPYFQSVSGERNDTFVKRYKARYGEDEPTNMCAEAAYFQVHLFANALARDEFDRHRPDQAERARVRFRRAARPCLGQRRHQPHQSVVARRPRRPPRPVRDHAAIGNAGLGGPVSCRPRRRERPGGRA